MFRLLLFFVAALVTLCSLTPISAHRLPRFTRGVYVILADNTVNVTVGDSQVLSTENWTPKLGSWILNYNVVFFTFINSDMQVPPSFVNARDSNNFAAGTKIIFSLGGYGYSQDTAGWTNVFGSTASAQYWAQQVAIWPCDGVDLDLESGAGDQPAIAAGIITFIQTLNLLRPNFIITQPGYGYPQVLFESTVVVNAFSTSIPSIAINAVGIMVYSGSQSLNYLSNYDGRACTFNSCPLCSSANVNYTSGACAVVPDGKILAGLSGSAATADVQAVCGNNPTPGGYMIWFASADNGFQYAGGQGDARINNSTNWLCHGSHPSPCASGQ